MKKEKKKEIEVSYKLVVNTTKEVLKNVGLFSRKGSRVIYMNATMQGEYEVFLGLPKGEPTRQNIIALIGREIARKKGIEPRNQKEIYNNIKPNIRAKIITCMEKNPEIKKRINKILKERKFRFSEWLGKRKKIGKFLGHTSLFIRNKRHLFIK